MAACLPSPGARDTLWPSSAMADRVMPRLKHHQHPFPFEHLRYEDAGHAITRPYVATEALPHGGTPAGAAHANADSWPRVLAFLHGALD